MRLVDFMEEQEFRVVEANGLPASSIHFEVGQTYVVRYGYPGEAVWVEVLQECTAHDAAQDAYEMQLEMILDASPAVFEAMEKAGVEMPD